MSRSAAATFDPGTPQVQAKRAALIDGQPVELIASVAGVMHARGWLSEEQLKAAHRFASLRARCFGVPLASISDAPEASDERNRHNERSYDRLCRRLTEPQLIEVVSLALGGRPLWCRRLAARLPLRPVDEIERGDLLGGLDAIADAGRE